MLSANDRPQRNRTRPPTVALSSGELRDVLSAVETAYEAAWYLADIGRCDFGPFEGLPTALVILRGKRDELRARAA